MCGLPASGKTTTAMRLHAHLGGVLIRSCDIYHELGISLPEWVQRTQGFTVDIAQYDRLRDQAYREMARRLEADLASGVRLVVLDAVHGEPVKRQTVYEICRAHGVKPIVVLCRCDDRAEVVRRFAARRDREFEPEREASDLSVFYDIKRRWQSPEVDRATCGMPVPLITYDTCIGLVSVDSPDGEDCVELIRAALLTGQRV